MSPSEKRSQIERATNIRNLCVRFSNFEAWIDADEYADSTSMQDFLEFNCDFTEEQAKEIVDGDFMFIGAEGLALKFLKGDCFDKLGYENASIFALNSSDEAAIAGLSIGIEPGKLSDAYIGMYDNFEAFVEERWDEVNPELPEFIRRYINYEAIAADWKACGDFSEVDGYVFANTA